MVAQPNDVAAPLTPVGSTATEKPLAPKRLKTEGIFGSPLSTEMETDAACLNAQQLDVLTNFFEQCSDPEISDLIELSKQIDYPLSDVSCSLSLL